MAAEFTCDRLDRLILYELDKDARVPLSVLAKRLKQAREKIEYRFERLISQGVISGFSTVVNPYKAGFSVYKTYLKLANHRKQVTALEEFLQQQLQIYWIAPCTGTWDLIYAASAHSSKEFYEQHSRVLSRFSRIILESEVNAFVDVTLCYKGWLIDAPGIKGFYFGGIPEAHALDDIDAQILQQLARSARTPAAVIAEKIGMSAVTVANRLERLEKLEIICGYRVDLNLEQIGYLFFKAQLFFNQFSAAAEAKLYEYCIAHPHITYYIRQIGTSTVEIELEVPSYVLYNKIIDDIRERFVALIRNVETIQLKRAWTSWDPLGVTFRSEKKNILNKNSGFRNQR